MPSTLFQIATWNVNSLRVRLPHVLQWLAEHQPHILALQETKIIDNKFPITEIAELGYHAIYNGQNTYNGVAILSKKPAEFVLRELPEFEDPQRRILAATIDNIRIINLYVPNGESLISPKYSYKLEWLQQVTRFIQQQLQQFDQVIVLGDFNIAPEAEDVYDPAAWTDQVLFSEPERVAFKNLLALGLQDSFRLFSQAPKSYTWWDYRMLGFQRNHGLRIDHILASQTLAEKCVSCSIDKVPRKWQRPSDHTPVVANFSHSR